MMLRIRSFNLALLLTLLLALLRPGLVAAHLDLERSEPTDGTILDTPPQVVRLWFNEELDAFESTVAIFDAADRQVDLGDAQISLEDRTFLQVSLPTDLPPGAYRVRWTAVDDADGHPVEGELTFTVAGTPAPPSTDSATTGPAIVVLVIMVGLVIGVGAWFLQRRRNQA